LSRTARWLRLPARWQRLAVSRRRSRYWRRWLTRWPTQPRSPVRLVERRRWRMAMRRRLPPYWLVSLSCRRSRRRRRRGSRQRSRRQRPEGWRRPRFHMESCCSRAAFSGVCSSVAPCRLFLFLLMPEPAHAKGAPTQSLAGWPRWHASFNVLHDLLDASEFDDLVT